MGYFGEWDWWGFYPHAASSPVGKTEIMNKWLKEDELNDLNGRCHWAMSLMSSVPGWLACLQIMLGTVSQISFFGLLATGRPPLLHHQLPKIIGFVILMLSQCNYIPISQMILFHVSFLISFSKGDINFTLQGVLLPTSFTTCEKQKSLFCSLLYPQCYNACHTVGVRFIFIRGVGGWMGGWILPSSI